MGLQQPGELSSGFVGRAETGYDHKVASAAVGVDEDTANDAMTPYERFQNFERNLYIRTLMSGDDDAVVCGLRVNLVGRMESGGNNIVRQTRRLLTQMMMRQVGDQLERLREIQAELAKAYELREQLEAEIFTEEDLQEVPGESPEDRFERLKQRAQERLEAGEITQEEYDRWLANELRIQALEQEQQQIIDNLKDNDQVVAAYLAAQQHHDGLLEVREQLQRRQEGLDRFINRLRAIRQMESGEGQDVEIDLLIAEAHEAGLQIDLPEEEGVPTDDVIDQVAEALETERAETVIEQQRNADEIVVSEAVVNTIETKVPEEQYQAQENFALGSEASNETGMNFESAGLSSLASLSSMS